MEPMSPRKAPRVEIAVRCLRGGLDHVPSKGTGCLSGSMFIGGSMLLGGEGTFPRSWVRVGFFVGFAKAKGVQVLADMG